MLRKNVDIPPLSSVTSVSAIRKETYNYDYQSKQQRDRTCPRQYHRRPGKPTGTSRKGSSHSPEQPHDSTHAMDGTNPADKR